LTRDCSLYVGEFFLTLVIRHVDFTTFLEVAEPSRETSRIVSKGLLRRDCNSKDLRLS